jgi:hypothetical protein
VELGLSSETVYASQFILPGGTTAAETMIIERELQNQALLRLILARQGRMIQVLAREGLIPAEAEAYILNGSDLERQVGM